MFLLITTHRKFPAQILVYKPNAAALFRKRYWSSSSFFPVTYNSTRKQFFAKLLGVVGAASVLPALGAKSSLSATAGGKPTGRRPAGSSFEIRHDQRAVARRDVA